MHYLHILQQDNFDAFFYALLHEAAGAEEFQKALKYGEGAWETEGATKTFDIIEKLASYTEKTTPANANDNDFRKNQQMILDNKSAVYAQTETGLSEKWQTLLVQTDLSGDSQLFRQ